jgi:hypothetical protein
MDRRVRATPPVSEKVTVTGNLTIAQGRMAVKNNDTTYIVAGLQRFVGFIDSLKDGARVTLEGAAITYPNDATTKFLRTEKLSINGKDYEVASPTVAKASGPKAPSRTKRSAPRGRR